MKSVIDETWEAIGDSVFGGPSGPTGFQDEIGRFDCDLPPELCEARAKLAAQAPAFARIMLTEYERERRANPNSPYKEAMELVLRQAGVIP